MIGKTQQNKIKKELSSGEKGYCKTILDYLEKKGILNANGKPFSESMIYMMLTQPISHARLERAIFDCFEEHVKLRQQEEHRRRQLLKTA